TRARARRRERAPALALLATLRGDHEVALSDLERLLDRFAQASGLVRLGLQPIDDDLDRVPHVARQLGRVLDADDRAVHARANETFLAQLLEQRLVVSLAIADQRREQRHVLAGVLAQDLLHDLLG